MRSINIDSKTATVIGIVVITALGFVYTQSNKPSHQELLNLRKECAKLAEKFVQEHTEDFARFEVLHSDYSISEQSCFGEFDRLVSFPQTPEDNFAEYHIYDLLKNQKLDALTYLERKSGNFQEWIEYY